VQRIEKSFETGQDQPMGAYRPTGPTAIFCWCAALCATWLPSSCKQPASGTVAESGDAGSEERSAAATGGTATPSAPGVSSESTAPSAPPGATGPVPIPGGRFTTGTPAGRFARNPALEPREAELSLGPFSVDARPYASSAGGPLLGITREHAARLCGQRKGRLCTELEWERACKGPESTHFPEGATARGECGSGNGCASGFGVLGFGVQREWTRSDLDRPGRESGPTLAVLRGAARGAEPARRRCAARDTLEATLSADDITFRCCYGAVNAARVEAPTTGTTFAKHLLSPARLEKLLSGHERTRSLAANVSFFDDPFASETVVQRGPGDRRGFLFTSEPLLWRPVAGAELLVVSARSGDSTSFVLVYNVLGPDRFGLASSFVMLDEPGPVVLAYNGYIRPRLHFSTCWGCPGETGKILYRDPDGAIILQP
jgi:hypothetical protein